LTSEKARTSGWPSQLHTAIALLGFAVSVYVYYPGLFTPDSIEQFGQAQSGEFSDWHPPAMAAVWRLLDVIHVGPEPLFLFHLALFWGGAWAFAAGLLRRGWRWGALIPLIGLLPFVFNYIGMLWKDVALASAWLFAAGWAFRRFACEEKLKPLDHALIWLTFLYGVLVRANSIFAAAPLVMYWLSGDLFSRRIWPQAAAAFLVPVMLLGATAGFNHGLLQAEADHPEDSLFLFDLVGISHLRDTNFVPGPWTEAQATQIRKCYGPDKWDHIGMGPCAFFTDTLDERHIWGAPAVRDAWIAAMTQHPLDYAAHRLAFTNQFLRWIGPIPVQDTFLESEMPDPRWEHHPGHIFRFYEQICVALANSPLFRPYFWLLLSLCGLVASWFATDGPQRRFAAVASASAAIYLLTYIPFGVASDFRYAYWSIIATLAGLAALCAAEVRHGRALLAGAGALMLAAVLTSAFA